MPSSEWRINYSGLWTLTFILIGVFFFHFFQLEAQTPNLLPVTLISKSDGLSLTDNRFIFKDSKGFTWISSAHGLHRYDGDHVTLYLPDLLDTSSLRGLIVNGQLAEDHNGNIWFCTYDAVNCYLRAKNEFISFTYPGRDAPGYYSCGLDSTEQLWLMYDTLLVTFDIHQHIFKPVAKVKPGANRGKIHLDDDGHIKYTITYNNDRSNPGFEITDFTKPTALRSKIYFSFNSEKSIAIRDLYIENDSILWIASRTGLYSFNILNEQLQFYTPFPDREFVNFNGLDRLNDSMLVIVSYGLGVFNFHLKDLRFESQFKIVYNEQEILEPPQAVYRDQEGGVWIAILGRGVAYFHPQNQFFKYYKHQIGTSLLTSGVNLNSLIELPDHRVWGSLNLLGAVLLKDVQNVEKQFDRDRTKGMIANNTKMSLLDSRGRMWVLTASGPCIWNGGDEMVPLLPDSIVFFTSLCEFRNGEMILGSSEGGLYKTIDDGQRPIVEKVNQVNSLKVYTLLYEHSDSLIYGAADLAVLDIYNPRQNFSLVNSIPFRVNVQCMVSMKHGTEIWIGTDQGIFIYNTTTGKLQPFDWMTELKELIVYGIVPFRENIIWLSTNQGLYKLDLIKQTFESYGLQNGTGSINFNPLSFLQKFNGEIWFGSLDGITVIDPLKENTEVSVSPINLTQLLINDEMAPWLICQATGANNITELRKIDLSYQFNTLSLKFTAIDYSGPEHAIYEYRMTGVDENWINSGHHGFARYVNLQPGQYTFEARALNRNQGTYSPVRSIFILIKAPFYQKSWFIASVVVLFIALWVFFFRQYERRKQRLQQLEFEKRIALESERLRIANDMHDDLGSGLSALSLRAKLLAQQAEQPEIKSQMNDFVNNASRLAQIVRETIWTINSKNDSVDNLVTRLHQYALEYFNGTAIHCSVDLMQEQVQTSISGHHRRELYLAYKEALHNVVKHALATTVNISIDLPDSHLLVIQIWDNGKGFNPAEQGDGLGLSSMLKHMQNIGGQFQIRSDLKGTQITLTYPF